MKEVSFRIALVVILSALMWNCTSPKVNQTTYERLYKKDNNELNAQYLMYHLNDTVTQMFYEISNEVLVYKKTDTSNFFYSRAKLFLKISNEENLDMISDTTSVEIIDKQTEVKVRNLTGSFFFKLKPGFRYHIEAIVFDLNKKTRYTQSLLADKVNKEARQNFLVTNYRDDVYFSPYFKPEEEVYIRSDRNPQKVFQLDYFKPVFKLAPPPFSNEAMENFKYKPDSSFTIYPNHERFNITLPQKGFFHLKTNEDTKDGLSFFIYEPGFPKIKNAEQMILATRFIMAKKEFDHCMSTVDKKEAIDHFWVELSGSNERAKQLIKKYYGRVQEANKLFSSYQEGWKTDRGMIYIVFGAPTHVIKRKSGEVWTYGETNNPNSIVFSFSKIENPFSDNDYYLQRNEILKMPWYQAVDMWRQGRIYLDN